MRKYFGVVVVALAAAACTFVTVPPRRAPEREARTQTLEVSEPYAEEGKLCCQVHGPHCNNPICRPGFTCPTAGSSKNHCTRELANKTATPVPVPTSTPAAGASPAPPPPVTDNDMAAWDSESADMEARGRAKPAARAAAVINDCPTGNERSRDVVVTPADLSLNVLDDTGFMFFHQCTSTNYQRWQLDEALVWFTASEVFPFADAMGIDVRKRVIAFAGPMPRYKGPTRTVMQFDHGPFYWDLCGEKWCSVNDRRPSSQKASCRHYGVEQYAMRDTQAGALRKPVLCAKLLTPTVGTLLSLKVATVNGVRQCVHDTTPQPDPKEPFKSARAQLGIADGECLGPYNATTHRCRTIATPLSPEMVDALADMHAAHRCSSDNKCLPAGTPPKACPSHAEAAERVKALAPDEETLNLVTMSFFSGKVDPNASAADVCTAFRIVDDDHMAWHQCVLDGDAACADRARILHQEDHMRIAYMNPLLTPRYFSEPSDLTLSGLLGPHARHPNLTARQLFDEYRAARPWHRDELARMTGGGPPGGEM